MQCACPDCQLLMGWVEKGIFSSCKCPECGYSCDACLGTNSVLDKRALRDHAARIGLVPIDESDGDEE